METVSRSVSREGFVSRAEEHLLFSTSSSCSFVSVSFCSVFEGFAGVCDDGGEIVDEDDDDDGDAGNGSKIIC